MRRLDIDPLHIACVNGEIICHRPTKESVGSSLDIKNGDFYKAKFVAYVYTQRAAQSILELLPISRTQRRAKLAPEPDVAPPAHKKRFEQRHWGSYACRNESK